MLGSKIQRTASSIKYNKEASSFYGDSIVLGCGHIPKYHGILTHRSPHTDIERFYTLDADASIEPDCVHDLDQSCPEELFGRFNFVLLEYLPSIVYFDRPDKSSYDPIKQFKVKDNIFDFMAEESVLLIKGGLPTLSPDAMIYEGYRNRIPTEMGHDRGYGLFVKGPARISPALIAASLNSSAIALVESAGFVIAEMKNADADQEADSQFIRVKAVEILNRQISRLQAEQKLKFLEIKETKIRGLTAIQDAIRNTKQSIGDIVSIYNSSTLSSGLFRSITREDLQTICQLEKVFLKLYESRLRSNPSV